MKYIFASVIIISYLIFPSIGNTQTNFLVKGDYIPNNCGGYSDPYDGMYQACYLAKKYKTPIYQTSMVIFLVAVETSPETCGFNIKNRKQLNNIKRKLLNSKSMIKVYDYVFDASNIKLNEFERRNHCNKLYNEGRDFVE